MLKESELFRSGIAEMERDVKIRPLDTFSDYVVEQLPHDLSQVREGQMDSDNLNERVQLVEGLDLAEVFRDQGAASLAALDLKMLESGIVHSGGTANDMLRGLVDTFSVVTNQPSGITYEEIVIVNPPGDRRTFTTGEVGSTEGDFYEVHRRIEADLDSSVDGSKRAIALLASSRSQVDIAVEVLDGVRADLRPVIDNMRFVGQDMRPEHFAQFRPFLTTHPIRNIKGPSGAFTAGVPTMELLLAGDAMPANHHAYLVDNLMYFPREGRKNILEAEEQSRRGLSLRSQCGRLGNPPELLESLRNISDLIRSFRGQHYRGVRTQVPQALQGNAPGTGGETDVKNFLTNRMKTQHI